MTAAFSDTYLLELRGLGVVWRTRAEHSPAAGTFGDPAPEIRDGIVGIGSSLRSRIGLLDARARPGGLTVQIASDAALDLLRAGGEPVRGPGGGAVYALAKLTEYAGAGDGHIWVREDGGFAGSPLTIGEDYIIGAETVRVDSLDTTAGDATRYLVTRGRRGSVPAARPVWWTEGQRQNADPREADEEFHAYDPVYPDLQPPTLTGWPARLWRADASGAEVIFDGVVSRVRSSGAVVVVEVASRVESEFRRSWREPWGYMLRSSAAGVPTPVVPVDLPDRFIDDDVRAVRGIGTDRNGNQILGPNGGPLVCIPKSSLPAADASLDVYSAVRIRVGDKWAAVTIKEWYQGPDDRFHYLEVSEWPGQIVGAGPKGAGPIAYGDGDGPLFSVAVGDVSSRARSLVSLFGIEYVPSSGSQIHRFRINPDEDWQTTPAPCYLIPTAEAERWAPDVLGVVETRMGGSLRYLREPDLDLLVPGAGTPKHMCIRAPYWGASLADVVESQLGGRGLAFSLTPTGEAAAIDWLQPPAGVVADFPASALTQPSSSEIGEPGRVSRVVLEWDGARVAVEVVGRSLSPRGVEIEREIGALLTDAEGSTRDAVAYWSQAIGRYRGTIPRARVEVRDDGSGAVQRIAPGQIVALEDPALPDADGSRGFDGAALVLEVEARLESRTAALDVLLIEYGQPAPRPWGPAVRVTTGASADTSVTLQTERIALGRGVDRWREIREIARPAVLLIEPDGTVVGTGMLESMDADGEAVVSFSSATAVPVGAFIIIDDAPPLAALPFATGYYGITEWPR